MGEDHAGSRQRLREFAASAVLIIAATAVAVAGVAHLETVYGSGSEFGWKGVKPPGNPDAGFG